MSDNLDIKIFGHGQPTQVQTLIHNDGFGHLLKILDFDINHHLITTVVRWRTDTHFIFLLENAW